MDGVGWNGLDGWMYGWIGVALRPLSAFRSLIIDVLIFTSM